MVDEMSRVIAHDQWIGMQGFLAVRTSLVQAGNPGPKALRVTHDEHETFLRHQKHHRSKSCSTLKSVDGDGTIGKMLGQPGLPIYVKHVGSPAHLTLLG